MFRGTMFSGRLFVGQMFTPIAGADSTATPAGVWSRVPRDSQEWTEL